MPPFPSRNLIPGINHYNKSHVEVFIEIANQATARQLSIEVGGTSECRVWGVFVVKKKKKNAWHVFFYILTLDDGCTQRLSEEKLHSNKKSHFLW